MKRISIIALTVLISLLIFSCASAPEEEAPAVEPEPKEQPTVEEPEISAPEAKLERAENLRNIIEKYDFAQYAENEYASGEEAFTAAQEAYGIDNETAAGLFDEATQEYSTVIQIGVKEIFVDWRGEAKTSLDNAQEVKAARAVPEQYNSAEEKLEKAWTAYEEENYESATVLYNEGIEELKAAVAEAERKRERARKSLEQTENNMQETERRLQSLEEDAGDFSPEGPEENETDDGQS